MMEWTDRHDRYFLRLISKRVRLYTEMVTTAAVIHGDRNRLIGFSDVEHPVALQLGGSEPEAMAEAARIAEATGYDEVNINVGCPSDRVQSGRFGACLMEEPETVAACVAAMRRAVSIPVTVKCRLGVDDQDPELALDALVRASADAGCTHFVVHARKAWLQGLSPKENRDIPPLDYDRVYRLKQTYPGLTIVINGGIENLDQVKHHLDRVDGAMLGRAAYQSPWILADADHRLFADTEAFPDRWQVVDQMVDYAERRRAEAGTPLKSISRHMLGLFQGLPGARAWRRHLSENAHRDDAKPILLAEAARLVHRPERRAA